MIFSLLINKVEVKFFVLTIFGFLLAILSREQFINLKHSISEISRKLLTTHGSFNAVGFGLGSLFSGLLNERMNLFVLSAFSIIIINFIVYPNKDSTKNSENYGLRKIDIYVATLFIIAIVPMNNSLGLLIYTNIFNEKIAGTGALLYTVGSLLSGKLKKYTENKFRPIGMSVFISSLLFLSTFILSNVYYYYFTRIIIGSILFSAQGLLEERSKNGNDGKKGIEFLWQIFSATAFFSLLILPTIGEKLGFAMLGILSLLTSLIIMVMRYIVK